MVESYGNESSVAAADGALECGRGVVRRGGSRHFGDVRGRLGAGGDVEEYRIDTRTEGREGREREEKAELWKGNEGAVSFRRFRIWTCAKGGCYILQTPTPIHTNKQTSSSFLTSGGVRDACGHAEKIRII